MGFLKKLLGIKPKTVGDAFRAVKKHFNAVGDDLAHIPGQRLYDTPCGNKVVIGENSYGHFSIKKLLAPWTGKSKYKSYIGQPARIEVSRYTRALPGDKKVNRVVYKMQDTFLPLKSKKGFEMNLTAAESKSLFNGYNYGELAGWAQPKTWPKALKTERTTMPYAKAVSMGLKV